MHLMRKIPYLAAGALAVAACSRADRAADTVAARADTTISAGDVARDSAMRADSMSRGGWTPASIFAFTNVANAGEIEEARLATRKATNPAVKAYARELLADHQAMLTEGKALASKMNVTPDTTAGDARSLYNDSRDEIKDMTDKAAGADWDKDFIDHAIDGHQHVLDKLQDAAKNTTDPELRAALEKATGKVQTHLTKAQDIKNTKLNH